MSDTPLFSPELEGLLREAAASPRSVLLKTQRPATIRSLLERQTPLGSRPSGFSALDRHLLSVHRDELARALLDACRVRLYSDNSIDLSVHRVRTRDTDWEVEPEEDWALRARSTMKAVASGAPQLEGLELLSSCLAPGQLGGVSITQLARAAQRLQQSSRARAWIVFDLRLQDRFSDAIRMAGQELTHHVAPGLAASLLEYSASAHASLHSFGPAAHDAWRAHLEDPEHVSAVVNAMHYSLLAGDSVQARIAGTTLDELVATPTPGLVRQLEVFERTKRAGRIPDTPNTRSIARALLDEAGPLARKVLHVHR